MVLTTLLKVQTLLSRSENCDLIGPSGDFHDTGLCCFNETENKQRGVIDSETSNKKRFNLFRSSSKRRQTQPEPRLLEGPPVASSKIDGNDSRCETTPDITQSINGSDTEIKCDDMYYFDFSDIYEELIAEGGESLPDLTTDEGFSPQEKERGTLISRSKSNKPIEAKKPNLKRSKSLSFKRRHLSDSKSKPRLTKEAVSNARSCIRRPLPDLPAHVINEISEEPHNPYFELKLISENWPIPPTDVINEISEEPCDPYLELISEKCPDVPTRDYEPYDPYLTPNSERRPDLPIRKYKIYVNTYESASPVLLSPVLLSPVYDSPKPTPPTQHVLPGGFDEPKTLTSYRNSRQGWGKRFKHGFAKFDDPNKDMNESLARRLNLIKPNQNEASFRGWSGFLKRNKEARNLLSLALSKGSLKKYLQLLQNSKALSRLEGTVKDNQGNEYSIPASFLTILGVSYSGAFEENCEIAMKILQKLKEINPDVVSKKIPMKKLGTGGTEEVDLVTFASSVLKANTYMNPARNALIADLEQWSTSPLKPQKSWKK